MANCRQCGRELPETWITDICTECSRQNMKKIFKEYPDVKEAFMASIGEMKKPENMKKMVDDTCRFISALQRRTDEKDT